MRGIVPHGAVRTTMDTMALERDGTGGGYRARTIPELWDPGIVAEGICSTGKTSRRSGKFPQDSDSRNHRKLPMTEAQVLARSHARRAIRSSPFLRLFPRGPDENKRPPRRRRGSRLFSPGFCA